jgi:hypothetical protein
MTAGLTGSATWQPSFTEMLISSVMPAALLQTINAGLQSRTVAG